MRKIAVIGLGYVGLGLAVGLGKKNPVLGYDISKSRIRELINHFDHNKLIDSATLKKCKVKFVDQLEDIREADFYIVSVSTPAYYYELPNLEPLIKATKELATILKKGDIVVYESTVYPTTTEEVCLPLLEEGSQLRAGRDFNVGYSPERINPNDPDHVLKNITKIISAQNKKTLGIIEAVYKTCCDKVYPVSNIMTAEAVKILENTQRDINIAMMNEFSKIMHAMNLNVHEIIEAAKTKWSFVPFKPGFVGGHCIAVDPLYLAFKAKRLGMDHDLILAARKVNDGLTRFVVESLQTILMNNNIPIKKLNVGIFGITYKEDTPDVRNSLALKFIKELKLAGFNCQINDPVVDKKKIKKKYDIDLKEIDEMKSIGIAIILVGHSVYRQLGLKKLIKKLNPKIIMDIPNLFVDESEKLKDIHYWSL